MKKTISLIITAIFCFWLSACDPSSYIINKESVQDVIKIELIEYENTEQKDFLTWVPDQFDKLLPFNNDKAIIIETLEEQKIPDFLNAFEQTDILHTYYAYNSPKDVCIKLTYLNGNFLIIWANYKTGSFCGYIGEYLADGTVNSFWGCFSSLASYEMLVNDFFDYNLYTQDSPLNT